MSVAKLLVFYAMLSGCFSNNAFTQEDSSRFTLSAGYGLGSFFFTPDIYISAFDSLSASSRTDYLNTETKIRPILLKFDYAINQRSNIGILFMYNGFDSYGIRLDSTYVQSSNSYITEMSKTRLRMSRLRIEAVYTLLFRQKRDWVRSYFYAGFGWNQKFVKYYENDQEKPVSESIYFGNLSFPIAMRFAYGFRIRITDYLSVHNEFGLGGPLYSLGITARFGK